jgi:hypothetical protein
MNKTILFSSSFIAGLIFCFFIFNYKSKETTIENVEDNQNLKNLVLEEIEIDEVAYLQGYGEGEKSAYSQFLTLGTITLDDVPEQVKNKFRHETVVQYASNIETTEEEQKAREKGYVDGYHKTIDRFYCPCPQ